MNLVVVLVELGNLLAALVVQGDLLLHAVELGVQTVDQAEVLGRRPQAVAVQGQRAKPDRLAGVVHRLVGGQVGDVGRLCQGQVLLDLDFLTGLAAGLDLEHQLAAGLEGIVRRQLDDVNAGAIDGFFLDGLAGGFVADENLEFGRFGLVLQVAGLDAILIRDTDARGRLTGGDEDELAGVERVDGLFLGQAQLVELAAKHCVVGFGPAQSGLILLAGLALLSQNDLQAGEGGFDVVARFAEIDGIACHGDADRGDGDQDRGSHRPTPPGNRPASGLRLDGHGPNRGNDFRLLEVNGGKLADGGGREELPLAVGAEQGATAQVALTGVLDEAQAFLGFEEAVQVFQQLSLIVFAALHGRHLQGSGARSQESAGTNRCLCCLLPTAFCLLIFLGQHLA